MTLPESSYPAMHYICTDALEEHLVQDGVIYCLESPSLSSKLGECMKELLCLVCCLRHMVINLETPWRMTPKYLTLSRNLRLLPAVGIAGG